jgi:GT2 family glycosyltransferase
VSRPAQSPEPPRVSVVICAYTEERWLDIVAAVESVAAQTRPAFECLLVVDHNPELAARARTELAGCRVVQSGGPKGLSGARNTGVDLARGDVVAFLDDDAVAAPDWLERLAAAYADPDVVAAGGLVTPAWVESRPAWFPPEFDWVIGCSHSGMPERAAPVRNLVGANMSLRRATLISLGGFSSLLGRKGADAAGCEETELCIRAGRSRPGAVVVYDPSAEVFHRVSPARATKSYFLRRCLGEGRSKAAVASLAGARDGLAAERTYVTSTLPRGVAAAAGEAVHGRFANAERGVMILAGLAATVAGYATGAGEAAARARSLLLGWIGPAVALALWVSVLVGNVPLASMTDLGLISVLPARFWIAAALLCVSFCVLVRNRSTSPLVLGAHIVLLLAMLHATPAILYDTLRYTWAWKHVAITDYVIAHHGVDLSLGNATMVAYQDWPGFFALNALTTTASGLSTPLSYASWAPFVFELLYALPLMLILRRLSSDQRVRWTALIVFYLGNWIGQDYFSPQAFSFFLYLVVLAVVFRLFLEPAAPGSRFGIGPRPLLRPNRRTGRGTRSRPANPLAGLRSALAPVTGGRLLSMAPAAMAAAGNLAIGTGVTGDGVARLAGTTSVPAGELGEDDRLARRRELVLGFVFVTVLMWTIAASHQLTPFMLLFGLVLLAIFGRLRYRSLAVLSVVAALGWMAIGARTFVRENFSVFTTGLGNLLANATVAKYNAGLASHDQLLVADVDRLYTALVGVLALCGMWRCLRTGRWRAVLPAVLLVVAPMVALGANNYGGEVVFRVYLFALPFLAFFVATLFEARTSPRRSALLDVGRGLVVLALLAGFAVSYYGKERSNYFPPAEVRTMESFYAAIPADSLIVSAGGNFPWPLQRYQGYENYLFTTDTTAVVNRIERRPVTTLARDLGGPRPSYLVFAASDDALAEMTGAMPPGDYARIEHAVLSSPRFRVLLNSGGVTVVSLAGR